MGTLSMTACKATAEAGCGKRPASKAKGWLGLGLGLLAIWLFVYGLAPWLQRHVESLAVLSEYIRRSGIDATPSTIPRSRRSARRTGPSATPSGFLFLSGMNRNRA